MFEGLRAALAKGRAAVAGREIVDVLQAPRYFEILGTTAATTRCRTREDWSLFNHRLGRFAQLRKTPTYLLHGAESFLRS